MPKIETMKLLYIVVPCYNEEEVLPETGRRLLQKINELIANNQINNKSKILFIDDGSKDKTWEIINSLHKRNNVFIGLKLSRNKGHQNALLAGLMFAKDKAGFAISLDADLQDDIEVIDAFIDEHCKGNEIVYGVRASRKKDTFFKKNSALFFYKSMKFLGVEIVYNHADYRLMGKNALQHLSEFKEKNLFLRGIIPLLGFQTSTVEYSRNDRFAGKSKYPLKKMIAFALNGITSFSVKPIRMITNLGFILFLISILALLYVAIIKMMGRAVVGWSSLTLSIWMLGGIQLLSIGIIGEYIGKIYLESKNRPSYHIEKIINE